MATAAIGCAPTPRLYTDLADWWPLLSHPSEYAEEAAVWYGMMVAAADRPPATILELGSGGGNNASHMKAWARLTLVDAASPGMLAVSRRLNPDCEHIAGDMRDLRLGRAFDAVFVHDAITYMTTASDLERAMRTAFAHCRPGGVALLVPDHIRETYRPGTEQGGHDGAGGRGLRYLSWSGEPAPGATEAAADFAYLLRQPDGRVEVVHDRHIFGLFPRATWLDLLARSGFVDARMLPTPYDNEAVIARRPG